MNTKTLQLFNKKNWNYSKLFICPKLKFQPGISYPSSCVLVSGLYRVDRPIAQIS